MPSPIPDVVQGYVNLASWLVDRWSGHASDVAQKLDEGNYDTQTAATDLAKCVALATESGVLIASEGLDALAICTGRQSQRYIVESPYPFISPIDGATLSLAGPLTLGPGWASLIAQVRPERLDPGATAFKLWADATGCRGGAYVGKVVVSKPPADDRQMPVWLVVA
jgi:hypothetical protein